MALLEKQKCPGYSGNPSITSFFSFVTLTGHGEESKSNIIYMFLNSCSDFCISYGVHQITPKYKDKRGRSGFFLCCRLAKYSVCEQVMVLYNSSGSGHVTRSTNPIGRPVLFAVRWKRDQNSSIYRTAKYLPHRICLRMLYGNGLCIILVSLLWYATTMSFCNTGQRLLKSLHSPLSINYPWAWHSVSLLSYLELQSGQLV